MIFVKCLKYKITIFNKCRSLLGFLLILQTSQLMFYSLKPQQFLGQESLFLIVKTQFIGIASNVMYLFSEIEEKIVVLSLDRIHINRRNLNAVYLKSWASGRIQIPLKPCINRIAITIYMSCGNSFVMNWINECHVSLQSNVY